MEAVAVLGGGGQRVLGTRSVVTGRSSFTSKLFGKSSPEFAVVVAVNRDYRNGSLKFSPMMNGRSPVLSRRLSFCVKASVESSNASGSSRPIAPLEPESPTGQFLVQILRSHPHLLPAAVDHQLEQLQADRDEAANKEEPAASGTELVLYRRIAQVKANERRKALEEIIYTLVVQRFIDADVSLIPSIAQSSDVTGKVDTWPDQDEKLKLIHSPEAYEMIRSHLALILGSRLGDSNSVAQISKLRVGQVYMASVIYGYFLKRVDQRFQLEKAMKTLFLGTEEESTALQQSRADNLGTDAGAGGASGNSSSFSTHPEAEALPNSSGFGLGMKSYKLRSYVMSFDAETLQKYATTRSKEAVSIIEKHTEALFGRPDFTSGVDPSKEEHIRISFSGLTTLVLEAVTFGSFLWDVESYVDSRYHFVTN